jgi:hypothetical protein
MNRLQFLEVFRQDVRKLFKHLVNYFFSQIFNELKYGRDVEEGLQDDSIDFNIKGLSVKYLLNQNIREPMGEIFGYLVLQ